jgi:hypothetical protein
MCRPDICLGALKKPPEASDSLICLGSLKKPPEASDSLICLGALKKPPEASDSLICLGALKTARSLRQPQKPAVLVTSQTQSQNRHPLSQHSSYVIVSRLSVTHNVITNVVY